MKTRIADLIVKTAAVAGLALTLAAGNGFVGIAQQDDSGNYFNTQTVPAGARTGEEADPYAPVDLGGSSGGALRLGGLDLGGASADDQAEDPCSPQRCKAW